MALPPKPGFRIESDSMGELYVPATALYGAQTQRAIQNFPISGYRFTRPLIRALGLVKQCAAEVNAELGLLDEALARCIIAAAQEVIDGQLDDQFVLDIFQTGSGTSTNMNANEVIANRASELLGSSRGSKAIHPNDHVNLGQSSNDVIPTALHLALAMELSRTLTPALAQLTAELEGKALAFDGIVKIARTHLQDATPIRLGQVFGGYARQAALAQERAGRAILALRELPIGGTAVGTGLNTHPDFGHLMAQRLAASTGLDFIEALNHVEAQAAKDALLEASGQIRTLAASLGKIANDLRWLASGPRCGIGEISLPAIQPGSSIMPGKVNPVLCEAVLMVVAEVIGADATVTYAAQVGSTFELNVMMPVMGHALLEATRLLASVTVTFTARAVQGIEANAERCAGLIEHSLAMCTPLAPVIGYDAAADIAKESYQTGKTVREVAAARGILPPDQLAAALDVKAMTIPGARGAASA